VYFEKISPKFCPSFCKKTRKIKFSFPKPRLTKQKIAIILMSMNVGEDEFGMLDLVSLGELLIDFTPVGMSEKGVPLFEQNAGGGPANLACAAAKLGVKAALMGKVGADKFGEFLTQTIRENGVDVTGLATSQSHPTALAFVHLDPNGDRSFSFRRKQSADTMISFRDLNTTLIDRAKYFFFSSFIMSAPLSRKTSFQAAKYAKKAGKTVVFDPNLRLNVWESEKQAKAVALKAIRYADIVKVSEEELFFLTGENTCCSLRIARGGIRCLNIFGFLNYRVNLGLGCNVGS